MNITSRLIGISLGGLALVAALVSLRASALPIPGQYIVIVEKGASPEAVATEYGIKPEHFYRSALNGFAGPLSDEDRNRLVNDSRVRNVEPDQIVEAQDLQSDPQWALDRIDQRDLPIDSGYTYSSASSVTAYIIDTGIRSTHSEFGGRVSFGFDAFGGNGEDCKGHGTRMAGTVGGVTYGVAKDVNLVAVRVLDCNGQGTISQMISGVDWVKANHLTPSVVNMSIGSGGNVALDTAVQSLILSGVTVVAAAANGSTTACSSSPARVPDAITISGSDETDARLATANYGPCVDFFAPGSNITSSYYTDDYATLTNTGTSSSAAFVTGAAALYLQNHPQATPAQVRDALLSFTTKGVVTNANTANNHLLYNAEAIDGEGDYTSPVSAITSPANNSTVKKNKTTTIQATASDNVGIAKVEFYVNGVLKCADTAAPYSCSWQVPNSIGAKYLLQTVGYDAANNTGSSPFVSVTATN
jgi:Fe2+ or Zn2+ uptake regulation protein